MEATRRDFIYDRLLAINIKIEPDPVPRPGYINEKIWECDKYIEEVSKYNIELTRDNSVLQTAMNNAEEAFRSSQEKMIAEDPIISSLPNIKDRVARANTKLRTELETIKGYKNNLSDSAGLLGAVNLKLKNLNRMNNDIRLQVRVLEAQIKLNALPKIDPVTASLTSEMAKSMINTDAFMSPETSADESVVVDPMEELNVETLLGNSASTPPVVETPVSSDNDLLSNPVEGCFPDDIKPVASQEKTSSDNILLSNPGLVDPVPNLNPEENGVDPADIEADKQSDVESDDFQTLPMTGETPDYLLSGVQQEQPIPEETVVDLDKALEGHFEDPEQVVPMPKKDSDPKIEEVSTKTNTQSASKGIDIDDLLDGINKKP